MTSEQKVIEMFDISIKVEEVTINKGSYDDKYGNSHYQGVIELNNCQNISFDISRKDRIVSKQLIKVNDRIIPFVEFDSQKGDLREGGINDLENVFKSYLKHVANGNSFVWMRNEAPEKTFWQKFLSR